MQKTVIKPDTALQIALELNEARYWQILYTNTHGSRNKTAVKIIDKVVAGMMPEVDVLACNRVIGMGMNKPATEAQIDAIIDAYKTANVPRFFMQVSPYAQPENIRKMLEKKGFSHYNNWAKLYRKADAPIPPIQTDLTVVEIGKERAEEYGRLIVQCFEWDEELAGMIAGTVGAPDYKNYFALEGDKPVAAAALYVNDVYASMAIAGTLPGHRGKGAQSALLARRIADAQALGCQHIISETAEEKPEKPVASYRNMRRMGFELAYLRLNYIYYTSQE